MGRTIRNERTDPRQSFLRRQQVISKIPPPLNRRRPGIYYPRGTHVPGDPASISGKLIDRTELADNVLAGRWETIDKKIVMTLDLSPLTFDFKGNLTKYDMLRFTGAGQTTKTTGVNTGSWLRLNESRARSDTNQQLVALGSVILANGGVSFPGGFDIVANIAWLGAGFQTHCTILINLDVGAPRLVEMWRDFQVVPAAVPGSFGMTRSIGNLILPTSNTPIWSAGIESLASVFETGSVLTLEGRLLP